MPPPLEVTDVRRSYGPGRGLAGVGLAVAAGEIYGLLGPNGAGKTSLVRAITGRLRLDAGTVRLFGRDPADAEARRQLGLVPQDFALYPDLSVRENLFAMGRLAGLSATAARTALDRASTGSGWPITPTAWSAPYREASSGGSTWPPAPARARAVGTRRADRRGRSAGPGGDPSLAP